MEDRTATFFLRLLLAFAVVNQLNICVLAQHGDALSLGDSLTENQTIISKNGRFALGIFSPGETKNCYVGMWYAQVPEKTVVWVANRETPLKKTPGVLKLSREGQLGLFDAEGVSIWWVNATNKASRAVLLDSGNFVLLGAEGKSENVWESFAYPTDTMLPGMKIGTDRKMISWKNSVDPAPGLFSQTLETDSSGVSEDVVWWNKSVAYWKSGAWNGEIFVGMPEMSGRFTGSTGFSYNISVDHTGSSVYFTFAFPGGESLLPHSVIDKAGRLLTYMWIDGNRWSMFWSQPLDQCLVYGVCGAFGICDSSTIQLCSCLLGFEPRDQKAWDSQEWWSSGCIRRSPFNCDAKNGSNDEFIEMDTWLPDSNNQTYSYPTQTEKECKNACLHNCSCTAFNYMGNLCQIWSGGLINMRSARSKNDSTWFVRVAASKGRRSKIVPVVSVAVSCAIVLVVLACLLWRTCWMRSNHGCVDVFAACLAFRFSMASRCTRPEANKVDPPTSIRMFTYKELQLATKGFTHKLGSGAFGSVFKGTLPDGTLVAVKKLQSVGQGEKQFRAEISTVGSINHVNLIRLRGFCAEKSRRLLVYDCMSNGSLNTFLFSNKSKNERKVEDWKTRFEIALGVARGLAYLHEECKERIIHCDVKPENILLDGNFCPKIGDFGLAKLVGRDFSRVLTTTRGTRGYLAPEWISGLPITPKADVYSFGMTLLEIISGRRNLDLNVQESSKFYFPIWAATQIHKEDVMILVDSRIASSANDEEVKRAVLVSMLCIQDDETVRPSMGQALLMLEGKIKLHASQIPSSLCQQGGNQDSDSSF